MQALLGSVLGQPTATATLERALRAGRVHHAYLFEGPPGVGKERAAFGLAQALVCSTRTGNRAEACGTCSACTRALLADGEKIPKHPDVVLLERGLYEPGEIGRKSPETQDISVDQVRTLVLARVAYSAHEGRAKVFIVRRAEELSLSAANALLKTLEEPRTGTYFILLTAEPGFLLDTIRSRTQRVRFRALPLGVMTDLLARQGIDKMRAEEVARASGGSLERARLLLDEAGFSARANFSSRAMASVEGHDIDALLSLAEDLKKAPKEQIFEHLHELSRVLAERAKEERGSHARFAAQYFTVGEAERALLRNGMAQLVLENMFLRLVQDAV